MPDEEQLAADLKPLRAGDPYLVIHFAQPSDGEALRQCADRIRTAFEDFPKAVLRQWFVVAVGRQIDHQERTVLAALHADRRTLGTAGIVVVGQSSQASPSHDDAEQSAFMADAAYALLTTDLGRHLPSTELWALGCCSAVYEPSVLKRAVAAKLAAEFIEDRLLADPSEEDPLRTARAIAEDWLSDLDVGSAQERDLLLQSPRGGIREALRVRSIELLWSQVSYWPDRLASWFDFLLEHRLPVELEQIDANLAGRETALTEALTTRVLEELRRRPVIARTRLIARGLADALRQALTEIGPAPGDPDLVGHSLIELKEELEVAIQRLPYLPAVVIRSALLGVITSVVSSLAVVSGGLPSALAGALAAGLSLAWGIGKYLRRRLRVIRARDEYLEAMTDRLMGTVLRHLERGRMEMIQRLLGWLGDDDPASGVCLELDDLRQAARQALTQLEGMTDPQTGGDLGPTEYARVLPSVEDEAIDALLGDDAADARRAQHRRAAAALFSASWRLSTEEIIEICLSELKPSDDAARWDSLSTLLRESPATRSSVVELLSLDVTPLVAELDGGRQPDRSRRVYLPPTTKREDLEADPDDLTVLEGTGPLPRPRLGGAVGSSEDDNKLFAFDIVRLGRQIAPPAFTVTDLESSG